MFSFFGISVAGLQVVGGVIFFIMGYDMLNARLSPMKIRAEDVEKYVDDISITPLGIPMIAGTGAITNAITTANVGVLGALGLANTTMKGYVDGQVSGVNTATTLSNTIVTAGIVTANTGMIGFVGLANTITATGITRSNLALKGYVDDYVESNEVHIGTNAGETSQGIEAVALGFQAGEAS